MTLEKVALSNKNTKQDMLQLKSKRYKARRRAQLKATILLVSMLLLALAYLNA